MLMPETLLSTGAAADLLGVDRSTIRAWIRDGKLPAQETVGGQYRIARADVEALRPAPPTALAYCLAIAHHAGGVGKTTTTSNLAYALAQAGQHVCVVDLDPQGDLSVRLGVPPVEPTLGSALLAASTPAPHVQHCAWDGVGFDVVAASLDTMAGVELGLMAVVNGREQRLRRCLTALRPAYDYLLLDCPPSLSLLMVNALYAADGLIIPVQAQDKAARQLEHLFATIRDVNDYRDQDAPVQIVGILLTMLDKRTAMAGEVETYLRDGYGDLVFATTIPLRTEAAADSRARAPLGAYAPQNAAARAHRALAEEVLTRVQ